jgi:N-acetylmuramoyl-L-alanine amidase
MKRHQVKQGDCISSIAEENGFFWETVWDHPENQELRELRDDPNILFPGDIVFVPDIRVKEVSEPTNEVHKFRVKNAPAKLKLRILKDGESRADEPFVLTIDGEEKEVGTISSDGNILISIPPTAEKGELTIGEGDNKEIYELNLGYLDPIETTTGVKARLINLGFDCGKVDNEMNDETAEAISDFQSYIQHPNPSGEMDDQTRDALDALHDESSSSL